MGGFRGGRFVGPGFRGGFATGGFRGFRGGFFTLQGTALSSALALPVTGLITAQDGVILTTDTPTVLTRLTHLRTITRTQMIIHTHILIRTRMFTRTDTPMLIHHVNVSSVLV